MITPEGRNDATPLPKEVSLDLARLLEWHNEQSGTVDAERAELLDESQNPVPTTVAEAADLLRRLAGVRAVRGVLADFIGALVVGLADEQGELNDVSHFE